MNAPQKVPIIIRNLLLWGVLLAVPAAAQAATHYVRAGAAGNGSGSDWTNAYTELPATLTRGDTYYVASGMYSGHTFNDPTSDTSVITIEKATVTDHGTGAGWSDAYGSGQAQFGQILFATSHYVFDGVTGGGPANWRYGHGFKIDVSGGGYAITIGNPWGSPEERDQDRTDITVRHVEVVGATPAVPCADVGGAGVHMGTGLVGHSAIHLSHLWLHDLAIPIRGALIVDSVLENSVLERNASSSGCHSEGWAAWGPSTRVTVRNNIFSDIEGTAYIALGNALSWEIYNNVFTCAEGRPYACGVGNGVLGTTDHEYEEVDYFKVHHNVFTNLAGNNSLDLISSARQIAIGNVAYNNMWFNNDGAVGFGGVETHDYNWFFRNVDRGTVQDAMLTAAKPHGQLGTADPFVDWRHSDHHLHAPTAAGLLLPSPFDRDMEGFPRGSDGNWDRGAYEFAGGGGGNTQAPTAPGNLRTR